MTVFADICRKYIKLYEEKPSLTEGHEIQKLEIPENPDGTGRVFIGLSYAEAEGKWSTYVKTFLSLDEVRLNAAFAQEFAIESLKKKFETSPEKIQHKNCEYYMAPVPKEKK